MLKSYIKENILKKYRLQCDMTVSALLVIALMISAYKLLGYAPFGENSLACLDANIQYLDFFSYFKEVLAGENNISYTFGKTLGGPGIAVFSYYLSSPLNLLVVLFEREFFNTFFHILVVAKLSIAAATFSYLLVKRFDEYLERHSYRNVFVVGLSVCYALSQYSIAQSSNIMWLDGVYMLPLILEGVFEVVHNRRGWKLSIFVGLSILFNWYTGGINCLFAIIWLIFEILLREVDKKETVVKQQFKNGFLTVLKFGCFMALGVMLSAVLFIPTIGALLNSSRGSLDWKLLFDISFMGDILSVILGYTMGAVSTYGEVSLYCGSLALLGCVGCFFSKDISRRKKTILGGMAGLTLLLFYWNPLFVLFSLLKAVISFWYRYSYCGIIVLLFLSALFFLTTEFEKYLFLSVKIAVAFSTILWLMVNMYDRMNATSMYTSMYCIIMSLMIVILILARNEKTSTRWLTIGLILIMVLVEMGYSVKFQMENYHVNNVSEYQEYVDTNEEQIEMLKAYDDGIYRITQTSTRNRRENNLTANYNEALAFNYWSISGYTSSPDDIQRELLDRMGYRINGENMCIVNTSIIGADSLLGVKYALLWYPIKGFEKIDELGVYNGKGVYENPYCLPLAFVYSDNNIEINNESNPFTYQNELYSKLLGEEVELYVPLEYRVVQEGNLEENTARTYSVSLKEGNYAVYGNIPWEYNLKATLKVNNVYETGYACWLSPSVFYIPVYGNEKNAVIDLKSPVSYAVKENEEQFYALDLDKLSVVTERISAGKADEISIKNGQASFKVAAEEGQKLYVSIPYDSGWKITRNGKEIETELFADCMYSIPLENGVNVIEMSYSIKYLGVGTVISVIGLLCLLSIVFADKKKAHELVK